MAPAPDAMDGLNRVLDRLRWARALRGDGWDDDYAFPSEALVEILRLRDAYNKLYAAWAADREMLMDKCSCQFDEDCVTLIKGPCAAHQGIIQWHVDEALERAASAADGCHDQLAREIRSMKGEP